MFRLRTWIIAGLLGAGLAYLLDPDHGRRRRSMTGDKARKLAGRGAQTAGTVAQQAQGRVTGIVQERVPKRRDNPNPDDKTLADRIESEVFRDDRVPKGRINVNVAEGIVELRGELDTQADIDYVVQCVRSVPDVGEIHNYLHLPGTPAPNKEEAIRASR